MSRPKGSRNLKPLLREAGRKALQETAQRAIDGDPDDQHLILKLFSREVADLIVLKQAS